MSIKEQEHDDYLDRRLQGLSDDDLRALSDKIIDRVRGLAEPGAVFLPPETKEMFRAAGTAIVEHADKQRKPSSQEEIDYFLNKARAIHAAIEDEVETLNKVGSYLEENASRGRLPEESLQKWLAFKGRMRDSHAVECLANYYLAKPEDCDESASEWAYDYSGFPDDDSFLESYSDRTF